MASWRRSWGSWPGFWLQGALVGAVMAILDLAELFWVARPAGVPLGDILQTVLVSLLLMAEFGGLVGLGFGALSVLGRLLPRPRAFLRPGQARGGRVAWTRQEIAVMLFALLGGAMATMTAMMLHLEFASGRLMVPGALAICGLSGLVTVVLLGWAGLAAKSRFGLGLLLGLFWAAFSVVGDRFVYPFSRMGPVLFVHWAFVVGMLGLGQLAFQAVGTSREAQEGDGGGGEPSPWASAHGPMVWVAGILALWGATSFWLRAGSNETRLLVFERTAFVFRPALLGERLLFHGRPSHANEAKILALCGGSDTGAAGRAPVVYRHPGPSRAQSEPCPCCGDRPQVRASDSAFGRWPVQGVLFLMVDALRADMLWTSREGKALTPNIRGLAAQSLFFDRAYSVVPATNAAVGGMLTGRYQRRHDSEFLAKWSVLGPLRNQGVWAGAVVSHRHCRHLFQGIDLMDLSQDVISLPRGANALTSAQITSRALEILRERPKEGRFFLFVHYYDPHEHYVRNPLFRFGWTDRDLYEGEVAYTDFWIGRLISQLKRAGIWENLAVILVGDHGDELWEHRYLRHRVHLYDEVSRVPVIVHLPGQVRGRRFSEPISTLGVASTILDLFGMDSSPGRMPSLLALAGLHGKAAGGTARVAGALGGQDGRVAWPEFTYMLSADRRRWAVVSGNRKVIFDAPIGVVESYDLESDPHERANRADRPDARTCVMLQRLLSWREWMLRP